MKVRIWVNPDGLRVNPDSGKAKPGGHWEVQDDSCGHPEAPKGPINRIGAWNATKPILMRLMRPLPCLSVWAGMAATFFWNSIKGLPEHPFDGFIDLPDGTPEQFLAAAGQTAIFLVWTWCFRSTIRTALRKELNSK